VSSGCDFNQRNVSNFVLHYCIRVRPIPPSQQVSCYSYNDMVDEKCGQRVRLSATRRMHSKLWGFTPSNSVRACLSTIASVVWPPSSRCPQSAPRFHSPSSAPALLARAMHPSLHTLWQSVAGVLVPESLAVDRARNAASRRGVFELVAPRAAMLQPGDLIVVRTPGTFYKVNAQQPAVQGVDSDCVAQRSSHSLLLHCSRFRSSAAQRSTKLITWRL
jgi:hypothetical protein